MATMIEKKDFDKHMHYGFKIGDPVLLNGVETKIIAIDTGETAYDIMVEMKGSSYVKGGTCSCMSYNKFIDTIVYRKRAMKEKYSQWIGRQYIKHRSESNS